MSALKISYLWFDPFKDTIFFHLVKKLSKKKIELVSADKADILFIGPLELFSFRRKLLNFFLKKTSSLKINNFFDNIDIYSFNRNYKPLRVFISYENVRHNLIKSDYYITSDLGIEDKNHFRFPSWKDYIDWSHEGIVRNNDTLNSRRFGFYWKMDDLLNPQGNDFMKKNRKFCLFTSHFIEPRKSIYELIKKHFDVDGYGPYFDKHIKNHNSSDFKTYDIMKNYAFNLCPQNSLFPGYYTEGVVNAFLSNSLPVTWADHNIKIDFNEKAFVNLIDDSSGGYKNICESLKDDNFLKNYAYEPILKKKIDLDLEKNFIGKILANL
jgi:hypothetical protein